MTHIRIRDLPEYTYIECGRASDDAGNPIFPYLNIWRWFAVNDSYSLKQSFIFPSIKPPQSTISLNYLNVIGQDFDGSIVGMISSGPEIGSTCLIESSQTASGDYKPPTVN